MIVMPSATFTAALQLRSCREAVKQSLGAESGASRRNNDGKKNIRFRMGTIRKSLLRWCYQHRIERFRGGYRLEQYLGKPIPVSINGYPPVYIDMQHPNWQAMQLLLRDENAPWDYEMHVAETLRKLLRPGDVVYDIGANIGLHTIFMHQLGANVFAFEPNPS